MSYWDKLKIIDNVSIALVDCTPGLLEKISKNCNVDKQDSRALLSEVIKYLQLIAQSNEILTPSLIVDLTWHELILFTRSYALFCHDHFGRFIHHQPGDNSDD